MNAKEKIISTTEKWISDKMDIFVASNPRMSIFAPRIKQGVINYIHANDQKVDNMLFFATDKDGNLDINDIYVELMKMFEDMPIVQKSFLGMNVNIGKGSVEMLVPDNFFTSLFMNSGSIKLTSSDFFELKELLMTKTV